MVNPSPFLRTIDAEGRTGCKKRYSIRMNNKNFMCKAKTGNCDWCNSKQSFFLAQRNLSLVTTHWDGVVSYKREVSFVQFLLGFKLKPFSKLSLSTSPHCITTNFGSEFLSAFSVHFGSNRHLIFCSKAIKILTISNLCVKKVQTSNKVVCWYSYFLCLF